MNNFPSWRETGQALRWARHHGITRKTRTVGTAIRHEWTGPDGATVHVCTSPGLNTFIKAFGAGGQPEMDLHTNDTEQVLGTLAALSLLPCRFGNGYQAGRDAGLVDLADELAEVRRAYAVVPAAGVKL